MSRGDEILVGDAANVITKLPGSFVDCVCRAPMEPGVVFKERIVAARRDNVAVMTKAA